MKKFIILLILFATIMISTYSRGNPEISNGFKFEYKNIENVEIKGSMFKISIEGKDISNVTGKIETGNKNFMLYHKQDGNTLVIRFKRSWWSIFSFTGKHKLTLMVPASTNIKVDNSSGRIDVKNINAENINLRTSSANIVAENIKGNQQFKSGSGTIKVNNASSSKEISLSTDSGNIIIEKTEADLKVQCTSGRITIKDAEGNKILNSSSGSINVSSSEGNIESHSSSGRHKYIDINGSIKAGASSGDIIMEGYKGSFQLKTSSGSIKGKDINITADSSFKTSSGNISIDYTNPDEDFTFDLSTSSGNLKAGSASARKKLQAGNGYITINGKSSSGSQSYR